MSIISQSELDALREWVCKQSVRDLHGLVALAQSVQDRSVCPAEQQHWFRVGRLGSEELERRDAEAS